MREAKSNDYWSKLIKRNSYSYPFEEIKIENLPQLNGINTIYFKKGIFAICGLNGAGKSTILSCLKDVIGIPLNSIEQSKLLDSSLSLTVGDKCFHNKKNERICDIDNTLASVFIDHTFSANVIKYFSSITNLDELIEQNEENVYNLDELEMISYLVGKNYSNCSFCEIELEDDLIYPYFKVESNGLIYDSLNMGEGEHFIIYFYWTLFRMKKSDIIILEEPETFISVPSQINMMNFLAKVCNDNNATIILSTHSPHILKNIPQSNICISSKLGNVSAIEYPSTKPEALGRLGLKNPKKGVLYFEDEVGITFAKALLNHYDLYYILSEYCFENAHGESAITNKLKYQIPSNLELKFIGIYDGDMKEKICEINELKYPYTVLPITTAVEKVIRETLTQNIDTFTTKFRISKEILLSILSKIDGDNYHDWLINLSKETSIPYIQIFEPFLEIWLSIPENKSEADLFIDQLSKLL